MLNITEKITITGKTVVDGKEVCGYTAQIDSTNPKNMTLSGYQINKELYKANRSQCRADQAEFEDYAYTKQDEMLAALAE